METKDRCFETGVDGECEQDKMNGSDQLVEAFFEDCKMRDLAQITMDVYGSYLRTFVSFCRARDIDLLTIGDDGVLAFIGHLRGDRLNCHKSLTNCFTAISSFYEFLQFTHKVQANPIPHIGRRYLRTYKADGKRNDKKMLSVAEMSDLITSTPDVRDRAIMMVLAKTGVRRNELMTLDIGDVDLTNGMMTLKPTSKRSNRVLFIDDECVSFLIDWLEVRWKRGPRTDALFIGKRGGRVKRSDVYRTVREWAQVFGYDDPSSKERCDHLTPHCFRHWFTTHMIRNGMSRDFVKELRGDARKEAIDLYNHIDKEDLRKDYLKRIPKLLVKEEEDLSFQGP